MASQRHDGPAFLAHHFDTPQQQFSAAKLGMWLFLAQELLFFSGLFVAYGVYRVAHPAAFSVGSHLLDWRLGTLNTCVLLLSSFTAAMAVRSAQLGEGAKPGFNRTTQWLVATVVLACVFLVVKYIEYSHKIHLGTLPGDYFRPTAEGVEELERAIAHTPAELGVREVPYHIRSFLGLYFIMTGVHGLHVLIGIGVFVWLARKAARGQFTDEYFTPVDLGALYWHLVDLIWIYLFPLLYLID